MKKTSLLLLSALMLAGCATSPVSPSQAKPVPTDRIAYHGTGDSAITITRDTGYMMGGCYGVPTLDGKDIARIDTGETVTIAVPHGDHLLGFKGDDQGRGLCSVSADSLFKEISVTLKPNETKRFRISSLGDDPLGIHPTSIK